MTETRTETEIRTMRPEDLSDVAELEKKIFSKPWSEQGFADSLGQGQTCYLVACVDGKIAGYCGFLQVLDEADITNVAVDEAFRKRGVGKAMLTELLKLGQERGVTGFTLEVRESNLPAQALYESLGFSACGIRKNFYDSPKENAVIMWKYL